ncbi:MAG: hypothetical protein M3Y50_04225 [Acidobacteriota bacterium]|nr:hypothetical protein [Acidobacteriota bacterium]
MSGGSIRKAWGRATVLLALALPVGARAQEHTVRVRVINAQTGHPVTDERLSVVVDGEQTGSTVVPDANGIVSLTAGRTATIRVSANLYADCRPVAERSTDYAISRIRAVGIATGNVCSDARPVAKHGELIFFEVPKGSLPAVRDQEHPLRIRVINAKTGRPVTDERLNVALRADQIGSVAMATDGNGIVHVDTGKASTIRILANMYADCRPRAELYTDYSIAAIRASGLVTGSLCGSVPVPPVKPGEMILFEIPKTYIPGYPAPPVTTMPHSDERPSSQ